MIEDSLRREIAGYDIFEDPEWSKHTATLQRAFPFVGSKIEWSAVPGSIHHRWELTSGESFLKELVQKYDLRGKCVVISDSALESAYIMVVPVLLATFSHFYDLPQHLYVFAENGEWCFVVTMEGDLDFGFAPKGR